MSHLTELLSINLLRLRKNLGLTQEEFARHVGLSRPTIARFESGDASTTLKSIAQLAIALRIKETELLGFGKTHSLEDCYRVLGQAAGILSGNLNLLKASQPPEFGEGEPEKK